MSDIYKPSMGDLRKRRRSEKIQWVNNSRVRGQHLFTFDKKKIYNLFEDYPQNLSPEEKKIFDDENPFWKEYFEEDEENDDT